MFYSILGDVSGIGYTNFFFVCAVLAIPGMILLVWVAPWNGNENRKGRSSATIEEGA